MDTGEDLNPNCDFDDPDGPMAGRFKTVYEIAPPGSASADRVVPITPDVRFQQFNCTSDLQFDSFEPDSATYIYKNDHPHRGICFIISNDKFSREVNMPDRLGAQADISNVYKAFHFLEFHCLLVQNVNVRQLSRLMNDMAKKDHSSYDCFACVILSHGEEGHVYAIDGLVRIDSLLAPFKGDSCSSLIGKPKLFFIQACRGSKIDDGAEISYTDPQLDSDFCNGTGVQNHDRIQRIPIEADFLLAFSVVPGYYSWRNSRSGSWFIQAISSVFLKDGKNLDLLKMLTRVSRKVAFEFESNASSELMSKKKQIPSIVSMLTKDVYFFPKRK